MDAQMKQYMTTYYASGTMLCTILHIIMHKAKENGFKKYIIFKPNILDKILSF